MPAVYSALDLACSSSCFGEGFPNVIGEAMACGIPCVVTDSGDSARVVGDTGVVVEPGQAPALAGGLNRMLELNSIDRAAFGENARRRIVANFGLDALVSNTKDALQTVAGEPNSRGMSI